MKSIRWEKVKSFAKQSLFSSPFQIVREYIPMWQETGKDMLVNLLYSIYTMTLKVYLKFFCGCIYLFLIIVITSCVLIENMYGLESNTLLYSCFLIRFYYLLNQFQDKISCKLQRPSQALIFHSQKGFQIKQ